MKKQQQSKYIETMENRQQLRFRMDNKICTRVNGLVREASAQLEELDYTKMYRAYRAQCCQAKDVNQPKELSVNQCRFNARMSKPLRNQ